jgi:hypothetical protein
LAREGRASVSRGPAWGVPDGKDAPRRRQARAKEEDEAAALSSPSSSFPPSLSSCSKSTRTKRDRGHPLRRPFGPVGAQAGPSVRCAPPWCFSWRRTSPRRAISGRLCSNSLRGGGRKGRVVVPHSPVRPRARCSTNGPDDPQTASGSPHRSRIGPVLHRATPPRAADRAGVVVARAPSASASRDARRRRTAPFRKRSALSKPKAIAHLSPNQPSTRSQAPDHTPPLFSQLLHIDMAA